MPEDNYLVILEQSLNKKLAILKKIRKENEQQQILLLDENLTPDEFEKNMQEKSDLVDSLDSLDQGFEDVYERVKAVLAEHKDQYREQIERLQQLIRQITAESNSIQAEEQRNYQLAQNKFASIKKQIREVKSSHKAVNEYYRSMSSVNQFDAQFMDDKK